MYNNKTQTLVSYEDEKSFKQVAQYAVDQGLGGMFLWEWGLDKNKEVWNIVNGVFEKAGLV